MSVENKPTPGVDFSKLKTFGFKKRSESRKEVEDMLLNSAKLELEAKGFTYSATNPDFLIVVGFGSKSYMERGVSYSRDSVEYDFISKSYSDIGVNPAPDASRQDNTVSIFLVTPDKTYLWKGLATSSDFEGIGVVGKCLVKGALTRFPGVDGTYREKFNVSDCP